MSPLLRKLIAHNWLLTLAMAGLLAFGIHAVAIAGEGNPSPSIQNAYRLQMVWVLLGAGIYLATSLIDYRWLVRIGAAPAWLAGVALLVYSLFKGEEVNDTIGWLKLGSFQFQPSQLAMAAAILAASACLGDLRRVHRFFRQPFVALALVGSLMGIPCVLVLLQGDIGSALVWLPVSAALCLVGNIPFRHLALVVLTALTLLPLFYFFGLKDSRRERIEVYLDMQHGRPVDRDKAYAANHAYVAVGSGGWNGFHNRVTLSEEAAAGMPGSGGDAPKNSIHAQGLLPLLTVHNDFIFAVIGERYGFRGSAMLVFGFCTLLAICLMIAYRSRDLSGRLIATGVAALIFSHMFQNMGMMMLLTPITGIPLPFISYGGTFMVALLFLMGLVQSVWIHREAQEEEKPKPAPAMRPFAPGGLA